ncbi:MAG: deoxyribodipyrimidine photo-lyase, partial [Psychroserpens sp.]
MEEVQKRNEVVVKPRVNIVWLKRDIRTQDHGPLQAAEQAGIPYIIIFLFEPDLIEYPATSLRHLQFQYHSILDFNLSLKKFNRKAELFHASAIDVFK